MSLYHDAASVLTAPAIEGSFKSRIYNSSKLKAPPAQIYALIQETSKWDTLLKEVIERAGILEKEPKLTPLLALLLVHDHVLSKRGIAAPPNHPLRQAVERHKTRLKAEFVKARVRRNCATVEDLKAVVAREKQDAEAGSQRVRSVYPRWVRVNNLRSTLQDQLHTTFASYIQVESLQQLPTGQSMERKLYIDKHIPDLVAVPQGTEFSASPAYRNGEIILQDKASCFPAYLLLGGQEHPWIGDLIDGCAAPGNKTTHLASLLSQQTGLAEHTAAATAAMPRIYAMDASTARAKTLQKMVSVAGADSIVTVFPGQDFLALNPLDPSFARVTGLLLDPSCSGSGIIGRDDVPSLSLPVASGRLQRATHPLTETGRLKRKRSSKRKHDTDESIPLSGDETADSHSAMAGVDHERLTKLSNLQTRIVEHALRFPSAARVTYSTCSTHWIENEGVVARVLSSDAARQGHWRVMRRAEQPPGLQAWMHRGVAHSGADVVAAADAATAELDLTDADRDACLRCWPGDEEGLGGFFVVGFVRDEQDTALAVSDAVRTSMLAFEGDPDDGDPATGSEWEGFSD